MKKIKILLFLAAMCFVFALAACGEETKDPNTGGAGGTGGNETELAFEVPENSTEEYGDDYTVINVIAEDASGDKIVADYKVKAPDGTEVSVTGGVFTLSQKGDYVITYTVEADGKTHTKSVTVTVKDTVAPVLSTLAKEMQLYKKGDTISVPEFTAEDACDGETQVDVVVEYISGEAAETVTPTQENTFPAEKEGIYRITATTQDLSGNESEKAVVCEVAEPGDRVVLLDLRSMAYEVVANENCAVSYSEDVTFSGEAGSLNVKSQAYLGDTSGSVWMNIKLQKSMIDDVTGYEYIYYYVFNNSATDVKLNQNNVWAYDFVVPAGKIVRVEIPKSDYATVLKGSTNLDGFQIISDIGGAKDIDLYFSSVRVSDALSAVDEDTLLSSYVVGKTLAVDEVRIQSENGDITPASVQVYFGDTLCTPSDGVVTFREAGAYTAKIEYTDENGNDLYLSFPISAVEGKGVTVLTADTDVRNVVSSDNGDLAFIKSEDQTFSYVANDPYTIRLAFADTVGYGNSYEYTIKTEVYDLTVFSSIYFFVYSTSWCQNGEIYLNTAEGRIKLCDVNAGFFTKVTIAREDYAKLFADPTDVRSLSFSLSNPTSNKTMQYFVSSVYATHKDLAALDLSGMRDLYAVGEAIDLTAANGWTVTWSKAGEYKDNAVEGSLSFAEAGKYLLRFTKVVDGETQQAEKYIDVGTEKVFAQYSRNNFSQLIESENTIAYISRWDAGIVTYNESESAFTVATNEGITGGSLAFSIDMGGANVSQYDSIWFYVWNYDYQGGIAVNFDGAESKAVTVAGDGQWTKVEIAKEDFAAVFGSDLTNAENVSVTLNIVGDYGGRVFISYLYMGIGGQA